MGRRTIGLIGAAVAVATVTGVAALVVGATSGPYEPASAGTTVMTAPTSPATSASTTGRLASVTLTRPSTTRPAADGPTTDDAVPDGTTAGEPADPGQTLAAIDARDAAGQPSPDRPDTADAATPVSPTPASGTPAPAPTPTIASASPAPAPPATSPAPAPTRPASSPAPAPTSRPPATPTPTPTPAAAPASSAAPAAPDFGIPVSLGNARQLITVTAPSAGSTRGTLTAWSQRADGRWAITLGPYRAWLGSAGIGPADERYSRTPLGTFTLTEAFGRAADPGTALPYHRTSANDWWVSDTASPLYNTMQTCAPSACPFRTGPSERLYYVTPHYDYAVVMDVNRTPVVPGGGSAFFLHIATGEPTAGCIAIDRAPLLEVMRWLDPAAHPRIATGVAR